MKTSIPQRTLGRSGLHVSAIGLGCMGMSEFYGEADEATNLAVLNHALDIGVNFLDTADMYGVGENERLVEALTSIAQARNCTPAQLALAWLLHQAPDLVPIPGTRSLRRLDENTAAVHLKLSESELQQITDVLASREVVGTRYPEAFMGALNV